MQPTNFILKSRIEAVLREAKEVPHVDRIVEILNDHGICNVKGYHITIDILPVTLEEVTAALEELIDEGIIVDSAKLWEG